MRNTKLYLPKVAFIDFDGTLIDVTERLYRVFIALTGVSISYEEYWRLKDVGLKQQDMLKHCNYQGDYRAFAHEWLSMIEQEQWLFYDKKIHGADFFLQEMKKSFEIVVCTNRQLRVGVLWELERFGWQNMFRDILVTEQKMEKSHMMNSYLKGAYLGVMIGDSVDDEQAACTIGIPFFRVDHRKIRKIKEKDGFSKVLESIFGV